MPTQQDDYNSPVNVALRERDWQWRDLLTQLVPSLAVMSFNGPDAVVNWLSRRVQPVGEEALVRDRLAQIKAMGLGEEATQALVKDAVDPKVGNTTFTVVLSDLPTFTEGHVKERRAHIRWEEVQRLRDQECPEGHWWLVVGRCDR